MYIGLRSLNIKWLVAALAITLSGCSSMSIEECNNADWYQVGYSDGLNGNSPKMIDSYISDCSEAAVFPDREQWSKGFKVGTGLYCSPDNGYKVGYEGQQYYYVCPGESFLKNYELGKQARQRDQRLKQIETELRTIEDKLRTTPSENHDERKRLEDEKRDLVSERSHLLGLTVQHNFNISF
jgi:hypothetical protein